MKYAVQQFWKKCQENLKVCDWAIGQGHANAAASRYYYALRLAAQALFAKRGIATPTVNGQRKWPHSKLWSEFDKQLPMSIHIELSESCGRSLYDAGQLRIQADYKEIDVTEKDILGLRSKSDTVFKIVEKEISIK